MSDVPTVDEYIDLLPGGPSLRYLPRNTVQTTRRCRFNCDYCSVIRINGRGSRHRDPEVVVEELRTLHARGQRFGPFRWMALVDDDLAADLDYTLRLSEAIVRSGVRVSFSVQASIGLAQNEEAVRLLARAGCRAVFTGLESASREALIEANKKNRPGRYADAIRRLHAHRILVEAGLIFGFDEDDADVFATTAAFADEIGVDSAHFSILTPLPGTHTFARMAGEGRIRSFAWGDYDLYHAVIDPAQMDAARLEAGLWEAYAAFYARSPRRRRWRRHVGLGLHPAVGVGITLTNRNYARSYRPGRVGRRPVYTAAPGDLAQLVATSEVPAEQAIATAAAGIGMGTGLASGTGADATTATPVGVSIGRRPGGGRP